MFRVAGGRDNRRSTGCQTCIKRRIKCDEAKPSCKRCQKSGRDCEGYGRPTVFVDERPKILTRKTRAVNKPESPDIPNHDTTSSGSSGKSTPTRSPQLDFVQAIVRASSPEPTCAIIPSSMELYVNFFIERLSQTRGDAGRMLTRQHDFLASNIWRYALGATGSPSLGNRPSLAMQAAHALVTVFFGKANKNIALVAKGMTMYGNTIRVLSQSTELKVPNESTKLVPYNQFEDTAMTMYLLGIYELCSSTTCVAWMQHAAALARFIELRGPEDFKSGVANNILRHMRFFILVEAMSSRKPTFLARPEWQHILPSNLVMPDFYGPGISLNPLLEHLVDIISYIPGLFSQQAELRERLTTGNYEGAATVAQMLTTEALDRLRELSAWHSTFKYYSASRVSELPVSMWTVPEQRHRLFSVDDQGPVFETLFRYDCLETANSVLLSSTVFIILRRVISNVMEASSWCRVPLLGPEALTAAKTTLGLKKPPPSPQDPESEAFRNTSGVRPVPSMSYFIQLVLRSIEYHFFPFHIGRGAFVLMFPLFVTFWAIGQTEDLDPDIQQPEMQTYPDPKAQQVRQRQFIWRVMQSVTESVGFEMGLRTLNRMSDRMTLSSYYKPLATIINPSIRKSSSQEEVLHSQRLFIFENPLEESVISQLRPRARIIEGLGSAVVMSMLGNNFSRDADE